MKAPTFVDLFAGCGGLSLGMQSAGWSLRLAVESHVDAFATLQANLVDRPGSNTSWARGIPCQAHEITELLSTHRDSLESLAGKVDAIVGGPPCQGFSLNGRRAEDDPRNQLVHRYLEMVGILGPRLVLLENVRGFTSMKHSTEVTFSAFVTDRLKAMGYDVWSQVVIASDWGVPQRRPRFLLVAARSGMLKGINPFERLRVGRRAFLRDRNLPLDRPVNAGEAISDLETTGAHLVSDREFGKDGFRQVAYCEERPLSAYQSLMRSGAAGAPGDLRLPRHTPGVTRKFSLIIETCKQGRSLDVADRARLGILKRATTPMAREMVAPTVTTLPDDMVHYSEPRVLTVREMARLQSFPDWFSFMGPYTTGGQRRRIDCPRYTQVANAVPPLLGEAAGTMLLGLLGSADMDADRPDVFEVRRQVLA
jgi:DNA (cytosine-5)-methyltransferase 1